MRILAKARIDHTVGDRDLIDKLAGNHCWIRQGSFQIVAGMHTVVLAVLGHRVLCRAHQNKALGDLAFCHVVLVDRHRYCAKCADDGNCRHEFKKGKTPLFH